MTDKNTIDTQSTADASKEIWTRVPKFSKKKNKTDSKQRKKQTHSPSVSASQYYGKGKMFGMFKFKNGLIYSAFK